MRKGDIVHHFLCINLGTNVFLLSTEAVLNIELTHCAHASLLAISIWVNIDRSRDDIDYIYIYKCIKCEWPHTSSIRGKCMLNGGCCENCHENWELTRYSLLTINIMLILNICNLPQRMTIALSGNRNDEMIFFDHSFIFKWDPFVMHHTWKPAIKTIIIIIIIDLEKIQAMVCRLMAPSHYLSMRKLTIEDLPKLLI